MKHTFAQVTAAAVLGIAASVSSDTAQAQFAIGFGGNPVMMELGVPTVSGRDWVDNRKVRHRGARSSGLAGSNGPHVDRAGSVTKRSDGTVVLNPAPKQSSHRLGSYQQGTSSGRLGTSAVPGMQHHNKKR